MTAEAHEASRGELVLYQAPDGAVELKLRLEHESLWISQRQMALLFDKDSDTIGLHLRNIYAEGELDEAATTEESSVVQTEGRRQVRRRVRLYNLDAVISVGYRVNSLRGTQFRIWATQVLREHLVRGYTANAVRLRELRQAVQLVADTAQRRDLAGDEAQALLAIVGDYNRALALLDDYDHQRVSRPRSIGPAIYTLDPREARRIVERLRDRFGGSEIFGVEKDKGLESALGAIVQTFDGRELYLGLEEKAAHLLYFLIKNHAFVDDNKRIAAALFLWFLERNGALLKDDGKPLVSNATPRRADADDRGEPAGGEGHPRAHRDASAGRRGLIAMDVAQRDLRERSRTPHRRLTARTTAPNPSAHKATATQAPLGRSRTHEIPSPAPLASIAPAIT